MMSEKKLDKEDRDSETQKLRIESLKKKEFYRDAVKKRNFDILEEKKSKTLWKLEKIELKGSPVT